MRFDYKLDAAGWATATLGDGNREIAMPVSYLHNSLEQLVGAILALSDGREESSVVFVDEPGEHLVLFRRTDGDAVAVEVRWSDDWVRWKWGIWGIDDSMENQSVNTQTSYHIVLEASTTVAELRSLVVAAMGRILTQFGVQGYKIKWRAHDFPLELYEKLLVAESVQEFGRRDP